MSEPRPAEPTYEIRAMGFAEILDTGFRLVRSHFVLLVGCAALLYVPLGVANALLLPEFPVDGSAQPDELLRFAAVAAGFSLLFLLVWPIVTAAITHAVSQVYLGERAAIAASLRVGLGIVLPLLGTWLLANLAMIGPLVLAMAPLLLPAPPLALVALLVLAAACVAVYIGLGFLPLSQMMVVERRFGPAALGRSYELMRGHRWRGFGIVVVSTILTTVLQSAFAIALLALPALQPVGSAFGQSIGLAFLQAVTVLFYFDLRCRKEAFDLEHLARRVEGPNPPFAP